VCIESCAISSWCVLAIGRMAHAYTRASGPTMHVYLNGRIQFTVTSIVSDVRCLMIMTDLGIFTTDVNGLSTPKAKFKTVG